MASYTTNLNLKKPAGSENVAIGDINGNMDIIDTAYGSVNSELTPKQVTYSIQTNFSLESWGSISIYVIANMLVINVAGFKSTNTLSTDTVCIKLTNITYQRAGNAYGIVWNGSSKVGNVSIFDNNGNIYLNRVDGNNVCFFNLVLPLSSVTVS